jgi:hypothetical protein
MLFSGTVVVKLRVEFVHHPFEAPLEMLNRVKIR